MWESLQHELYVGSSLPLVFLKRDLMDTMPPLILVFLEDSPNISIFGVGIFKAEGMDEPLYHRSPIIAIVPFFFIFLLTARA